MSSNFQEPVNLGNPIELSILDLVKKIEEKLGVNLEVSFKPLPGDDPTRRCPDISLAREILHWEPATDFEIGLEKIIKWFGEGSDKL